ncbi:MAG: endo-1,4-beta-xylanase [Thermoguttaceae bacterium]|nr:endo-1,4-beta-xylanase [Thermoguttaceae bacterium]MDW8037243.1 endo-1,4-beta-xylanase [Thermoguttaceae bacterium]
MVAPLKAFFTGVCFTAVFLLRPINLQAGLPESYRKAWSDLGLVARIEKNIEQYRKQEARLKLLDSQGRPLPNAAVEIYQKSHAFLFGCNAFVLGQMGEKNGKYEEMYTRLFNFATVPFYWEGTEPTQGELRYQEGGRDIWRRPPPDRYIPFAKKYGITLKGHPLLWHSLNPPWIPKEPKELKKLYQKRFAQIAQRYAESILIWDVVNESLVCPNTYPLYTPEREYVAWAFQEAQRVFRPENILMINEVQSVSHAGVGEKNAYFLQIRDLLKRGVKIEGIGFQFHFFTGQTLQQHLECNVYPPDQLLKVYESFCEFGLPLYITEITIPTTIEDGLEVQAEVLRNLYRLWFSVPLMAGITYWNLADGTAYKGENEALAGLVDKNLDPKPSYLALERLIHHEWKTCLSTASDQNGIVTFRGFRGKYTVRVKAGQLEREFEIELPPEGPQSEHHLQVK